MNIYKATYLFFKLAETIDLKQIISKTPSTDTSVQKTYTAMTLDEKKEFIKDNGVIVPVNVKNISGNAYFYHNSGETLILLPNSKILELAYEGKLVPRIIRPDMHDYNKVAQAIVKYVRENKDPSLSDIKDNKEDLLNFVLNILGQGITEGASSNYSFGNIQVLDKKNGSEKPNGAWKGDVFCLPDYNIINGQKIGYVWLYKSHNTLYEGVSYWLQYFKQRGLISAAKQKPREFTEALSKARYFVVPTKDIIDEYGNKKRIIDDKENEKAINSYLSTILSGRNRAEVVAAAKAAIGF